MVKIHEVCPFAILIHLLKRMEGVCTLCLSNITNNCATAKMKQLDLAISMLGPTKAIKKTLEFHKSFSSKIFLDKENRG